MNHYQFVITITRCSRALMKQTAETKAKRYAAQVPEDLIPGEDQDSPRARSQAKELAEERLFACQLNSIELPPTEWFSVRTERAVFPPKFWENCSSLLSTKDDLFICLLGEE